MHCVLSVYKHRTQRSLAAWPWQPTDNHVLMSLRLKQESNILEAKTVQELLCLVANVLCNIYVVNPICARTAGVFSIERRQP